MIAASWQSVTQKRDNTRNLVNRVYDDVRLILWLSLWFRFKDDLLISAYDEIQLFHVLLLFECKNNIFSEYAILARSLFLLRADLLIINVVIQSSSVFLPFFQFTITRMFSPVGNCGPLPEEREGGELRLWMERSRCFIWKSLLPSRQIELFMFSPVMTKRATASPSFTLI